MGGSFTYKFSGKNIEKGKIPFETLRSITSSIDNINHRICFLDYKKKKMKKDLDIQINVGSTSICLSTMDNEVGSILSKHEDVWKGIEKQNFEDAYIIDPEIRRATRDLLKRSNSWADTLQVSLGNNIPISLDITDKLINSIPEYKIKENYNEHISYVYSLNVKTHIMAIEFSDGKKHLYMQKDQEDKIKKYLKDYIHIGWKDTNTREGSIIQNFSLIKLSDEPSIRERKDESIISRFDEIYKLEKNWDGYEGKSIEPKLVKKAERYISYIYNIIDEFHLTKSIPPFICPTSEGMILFEWDNKNKHLEVEFGTEESIYILKEFNEKIKEYKTDKIEIMLDAILWVLKDE